MGHSLYQHATAWIVLTSIFMFVLPRISHRFSTPGSFAMAISFPIMLGIYAVNGVGLYITSHMAILSASIVFVLIISTILSDRPDMATKHLIIYSAAIFIGMAFSGYDIWLIVIYSAILHSIFICVPIVGQNNGFLGNSNFAGAFIAPCILISLHIHLVCPQPLVAALLVAVLYKTKCKGAVLGLVAGALFISTALSIIFAIIYLPLFLEIKVAWWTKDLNIFSRLKVAYWSTRQKNTISLKIRLSMWRSSMKFMTLKRFFFGIGGDVGRILFMKDRYQKPRFRRLHSDLVQGLFDGGIFYVILYLWIGIYSITIAPPALAAALLSLMVAGLFVDTQLIHFTSALFWLLVGQINFSIAPAVIVGPWLLPVAIILLVLAIQTWGKALIADIIHGIAFRRGNGKLMALAHKVDPLDDLATASLVGAMILSKQHGPAFNRAWNLVNRYNADLPVETSYYLLALASFKIGAYSISRAMAQQCLVYAEHAGAKQILKVIDKGSAKPSRNELRAGSCVSDTHKPGEPTTISKGSWYCPVHGQYE